MLFLCMTCTLFSRVADALTLSPAKVEVSGDPGATIRGEFIVLNEQQDTMVFYTSAENFTAEGESGTPSFKKESTGLSSWVTIDPSFTLTKGEQKVIPFDITVPKDAEPGGHFAAIFLSTTPSVPAEGQVSVGAKIGVLVLLRVSGEIRQEGGVVDFASSDGKRLYSSLPISFSYRYKNAGNDRVIPAGDLTIRNILGWEKATVPANGNQGNVLPGSIRKFEVSWGKPEARAVSRNFFDAVYYEFSHFAFGGYKALLTIQKSDVSAPDMSFVIFVIPWHLLSVVIVIMCVLVLFFTKGLKRYNRWIIAKAQQSHKSE